MARNYYNRYEPFIEEGEHKIVPGITLPIKGTDRYRVYAKSKDRLDKVSDEFYGSPTFGWLIMLANPHCGLNEFEIEDTSVLRIPFPLITSLQDYKQEIEKYKMYYDQ